MSNKHKNRKEKVLGSRKKPTWLFAGLALVVIALVVVLVGLKGQAGSGEGKERPKVAEEQSYGIVEMTEVKPEIKNGQVQVDLSLLKEKKILRIEDPRYSLKLQSGATVPFPLVVYLNNKGEVVAAVSDCEPCDSTRFHIEGDVLVCNACGTRWTLNDLTGVSGGCTQYPPDEIPVKVEGSKVIIDENTYKNWQPRI